MEEWKPVILETMDKPEVYYIKKNKGKKANDNGEKREKE